MERIGTRERLGVISELTQGRELANELKRQLDTRENCNKLLEKILFSYDNALTMLDFLGSPISTHGSPKSVGELNPNCKDQSHKQVTKKRKLLPKMSKQVRVSSETGFDAQLSDGYNWRKYGQKAILGAINPRSYYRCTHRHTQGCHATKQVQRSDVDPCIFDISYQGNHSCTQEKMKLEDNAAEKKQKVVAPNELCIKEETQELDSKDQNASSVESDQVKETHPISDANNLVAETIYLPPFSSSPATPESYFSMSPNDFDFAPNFHNIPLAEIISYPSPVKNFTFGDFDVLFDQSGFESSSLDSFDYL